MQHDLDESIYVFEKRGKDESLDDWVKRSSESKKDNTMMKELKINYWRLNSSANLPCCFNTNINESEFDYDPKNIVRKEIKVTSSNKTPSCTTEFKIFTKQDQEKPQEKYCPDGLFRVLIFDDNDVFLQEHLAFRYFGTDYWSHVSKDAQDNCKFCIH